MRTESLSTIEQLQKELAEARVIPARGVTEVNQKRNRIAKLTAEIQRLWAERRKEIMQNRGTFRKAEPRKPQPKQGKWYL